MLRLLGFIVIVIICLEIAPWGVLVGAILLAGWLLIKPSPRFKFPGLRSHDEELRVADAGSSYLNAIPLPNAVYCVNCNFISNSPHDICRVCGSPSVVGVSRIWKLTLAEATTNEGRYTRNHRYKISFSVDISEIPANGLNESTKLISRLAELGGDVNALHIKVDPVFPSEATPSDAKTDVLKAVRETETSVWQQGRRQAS